MATREDMFRRFIRENVNEIGLERMMEVLQEEFHLFNPNQCMRVSVLPIIEVEPPKPDRPPLTEDEQLYGTSATPLFHATSKAVAESLVALSKKEHVKLHDFGKRGQPEEETYTRVFGEYIAGGDGLTKEVMGEVTFDRSIMHVGDAFIMRIGDDLDINEGKPVVTATQRKGDHHRLFPLPPKLLPKGTFAHHDPFLKWPIGTPVWFSSDGLGMNTGNPLDLYHGTIAEHGHGTYSVRRKIGESGTWLAHHVPQSCVFAAPEKEELPGMHPIDRITVASVNGLARKKLLNDSQYRDRLLLELDAIRRQQEWEYVWALIDRHMKYRENENNLLVYWLNDMVPYFDLDKPPKYSSLVPDVGSYHPFD